MDRTVKALSNLLEGTGEPALPELRSALTAMIDTSGGSGAFITERAIKRRVYRLTLSDGGTSHAWVVKCMDPIHAWRERMAVQRWLPAIGAAASGSPLLAVAAEQTGQHIWHIYDDLGDAYLNPADPNPEPIRAAVELISQIHIRFAEHRLLPECRLYGGELGVPFYSNSVQDAIRALKALRPRAVPLRPEELALRNRLLDRMHRLLDEDTLRARAMTAYGGPTTLLHGDLWETNVFVIPAANGWQARLTDWERVGVGPVSYDLSTFLLRHPPPLRMWVAERYRECLTKVGWDWPSPQILNLLFETAEFARYANSIIWPALALYEDHAEWATNALAEVDRWFEAWQPVLDETEW